jgi:hypothetical protein
MSASKDDIFHPEMLTVIITAFDAMAKIREITGDPAARGIRECIKYLQDLENALAKGNNDNNHGQ